MYRDVKKKLLSVALCICMIIGMVQIVPKAKATISGNTITVQGRNEQGNPVTCTLVVQSLDLSYTGASQVPKILYANEGTNKIKGSENWTLTAADEGINVGTDHACYPTVGGTGGYSFAPEDTTFCYTISKATIIGYDVQKASEVVLWKSGGVKPELSSVSVTLNSEVSMLLTEDQYEVTSNTGTGYTESTLTINDANIDVEQSKKPSPISYCIAYPLNGTLADGSTECEMFINNPTGPYTGGVLAPEICIKKKSDASPTPVNDQSDFSKNFAVKYFKKDAQDQYVEVGAADICNVGTYKVQVTARNGFAKLGSDYYTGTYEGIYTITAKNNNGLIVVADVNNQKGVQIYKGNKQYDEDIICTYVGNDTPVKLQNVQVWDGSTNVTDQFEQIYTGETGVGNASLTLRPIKNQSNYSSDIYISYYITSDIEITDIQFEGYEKGVTDIFYCGQPVTPKSFKVVNKNNVPVEYTYSYKYQSGGAWFSASGSDDPNLATIGLKRLYVYGDGKYSGTEVYVQYSVSAVDMSVGSKYGDDFTLELNTDDVQGSLEDGYFTYYAGEPREPRTILQYETSSHTKITLKENVDYKVDYGKNHTNGGEVTVTVTALPNGSYTGSRTIEFTIYPVSLDQAHIKGDTGVKGFAYTGEPIVPRIVLESGSNYSYELQTNDYEVAEYYDLDADCALESAPKELGNYQITIRNKNTANNISGTEITLQYEIVNKDISKDLDSSFILSGVNTETSVDGTVVTRTIEWNGGETKPAVICGNMVEGRDFELTYNNCEKPGSAEVVITGKGSYVGTKKISYTITPRNLSNINIKATYEAKEDSDFHYNVTFKLTDEGEFANNYVLSQNTEYQVESVTYVTEADTQDYKDQISNLPKAGKYQVVLEAAAGSKYTGTRTLTVGCGKDITKATFSISEEDLVYNGDEKMPEEIMLSIPLENGKKETVLYKPVDPSAKPEEYPFTLEFDRKDAVSATNLKVFAGDVYVTATGNPKYGYYGTTEQSGKYTIDPQSLSGYNPQYEIEIIDGRGAIDPGTGRWTVPYTGNKDEPWHPQIKVVNKTDSNKVLSSNMDYDLSYDPGCIEQGDYNIIVTGKENYVGTIKQLFTIGRVSIANATDAAVKLIKWTGNETVSYAEGIPEPILKMGDYTLVKDQDYSYSQPVLEKGDGSDWNNTYVFYIKGLNNFTGTREEKYVVKKTDLVAASNADSWAPGQVYINRWDMDELMVDPGHIEQKKPEQFSLCYKKQDGTIRSLDPETDYDITLWGQNKYPGTEGNTVTIEGKNGFSGKVIFPVTLYTDISLAEFITGEGGSTIVSGGSIAIARLEEALNSSDPSAALANMVSLKTLWREETGGKIDPSNYTVTVPGGYTPKIGQVVFTISGTQQAPSYYGGSMEITMRVTGALDENIRVEIGDNNIVEWQGETVMPDNTKVQVYDGNKLLTGGYLHDGDTIPEDWDYTVTFSDNTDIGLATAIINGVNKYDETLTKQFKITCSMSDLTIRIQDSDGKWVNYDGGSPSYLYKIDTTKNRPAIKLYYATKTGDLREVSKDLYSITYNSYENAGNANAVIGEPENSNYKGILLGNNRTVSYTLEQIPIDQVTVALTNPTPTFTGNEIKAADIGLTLTYGTYPLTDADYKLSYYNNINTDDVDGVAARVVISAKGNFSGVIEKEFTILPMPIYSSIDINDSSQDLIYTGSEQVPKITLNQVTGKLCTLREGIDYKIVCYLDETKSRQSTTPYTEIGNYYVRVEGLGNYRTALNPYRDVPYRIVERQMEDGVEVTFVGTDSCPIINGMPDCVYNGMAHEPAVQVVYNQQVLKGPDAVNPDYSIVYTNNTNAGTATITITGSGSFYGTKSVDFTIRKKDISGEDMAFIDVDGRTFEDEKAYAWTKNPVQPAINVYDQSLNKNLLKGDEQNIQDYLVTYEDDNQDGSTQVNAGQVTLTVKGQGNYTGSKEFTYYIGEDISKSYTLINGKNALSTEYNGLVQAPNESDISVVWGASSDLTDESGEKRYDIAYYKDGFAKSNLVTRDQIVNAGTYYVAVVGVPSKGTYAKSSEDNSSVYTITPRSIAPSYILVSGYDGSYYYTGQAIEPKGIAVEDTDLPVPDQGNAAQRRSVQLTNGMDFDLSYANNVSAGKASIIVTGKGNYTGSRVAYFNIVSSAVDGNNTWDGSSEGTGSISDGTTTIAAADIQLGYDNSAYNCMMYNGYERIPTVTINGKSSNDFIITASNNIRPGIATLTITGNGNNYTGSITKTYEIKADLSSYGMISAIADQDYTGYQITPYVIVTCGGNFLNQGSDYSVSYLNNVNVGKATVMVTAASNSYYVGTVNGSFNISNTAGGMEITGYASTYTYTGYAITPDVVVMMNGNLLNRGTDYVVSYSNNTNVGTATMTVTGIGSYSGTKTINYAIEAKNIENCLTTAVGNYQYSGSSYTPSVTVTDSSTGKTLVAGSDYTITYSNNTNPGTASITLTALSKNYSGSKVIPFKITSAAVSGLRTSSIKNNSMKLSWSKQEYADGYQICNSSNRVVATTTKNSYTVKGLTSCTTYKFKVRSYVENADGSVSYGNFSTAVSAKTLLNTPKLTAKSTGKGKVALTWTKVSKATGYEIYYSTKKDGIYTRLKTVSKSSSRKYVDSGLASGEKYYYTIRAYRTANGVKTYSNYNTIKSVKVK